MIIYSYFEVNRPRSKGTPLLIGFNLSANPFKTSFPARGWKCSSWRLCRFSRGGASKTAFPVGDWERDIIVGWVERSETQQSIENVWFRPSTQPTLVLAFDFN